MSNPKELVRVARVSVVIDWLAEDGTIEQEKHAFDGEIGLSVSRRAQVGTGYKIAQPGVGEQEYTGKQRLTLSVTATDPRTRAKYETWKAGMYDVTEPDL